MNKNHTKRLATTKIQLFYNSLQNCVSTLTHHLYANCIIHLCGNRKCSDAVRDKTDVLNKTKKKIHTETWSLINSIRKWQISVHPVGVFRTVNNMSKCWKIIRNSIMSYYIYTVCYLCGAWKVGRSLCRCVGNLEKIFVINQTWPFLRSLLRLWDFFSLLFFKYSSL